MSYSARSDIEGTFGKVAVAEWADLDGLKVEADTDTRIARAIVVADAMIDDTLRGGPYAVPFDVAPTTIVEVSAVLAGVWLYENRGTIDMNPETGAPQHRLASRRSEARKTLRRIRKGDLRLAVTEAAISYPKVIEDASTTGD